MPEPSHSANVPSITGISSSSPTSIDPPQLDHRRLKRRIDSEDEDEVLPERKLRRVEGEQVRFAPVFEHAEYDVDFDAEISDSDDEINYGLPDCDLEDDAWEPCLRDTMGIYPPGYYAGWSTADGRRSRLSLLFPSSSSSRTLSQNSIHEEDFNFNTLPDILMENSDATRSRRRCYSESSTALPPFANAFTGPPWGLERKSAPASLDATWMLLGDSEMSQYDEGDRGEEVDEDEDVLML